MTNAKLRLGDLLPRDSARNIALAVIDQLTGRLVLTEDANREDYESCRLSIGDIRHYLSGAATSAAAAPDLRQALTRMREASMNFLRSAGTNSQNFQRDHTLFVANLDLWRLVMVQEIHWMCAEYDIDLPDSLRHVPLI